MMTFAMSENTIEAMERSAEKAGYDASRNDKDGISKILAQVLREQHCLGNTIEEVRPSLKGWYLYLSGTVQKEDRQRIATSMAAKTGYPKEAFEIVAFYNWKCGRSQIGDRPLYLYYSAKKLKYFPKFTFLVVHLRFVHGYI